MKSSSSSISSGGGAPMEVKTAAHLPPSLSGSSSAAAYPRWVILECSGNTSKVVNDDANKTLAAARTRKGHPIQVSLGFADPPAASVLRVRFPDGVHEGVGSIMAAHRDSLLLYVILKFEHGHFHRSQTVDYFVYNAGDPPSLLLLPRPGTRGLLTGCTGILHPRRRCRGEDDDGEVEVVVAELTMVDKDGGTEKTTNTCKVGELLLFRSGAWSVKRLRICYGSDEDEEEGEKVLAVRRIGGVFAVGDRTLGWVVCDIGSVLLCDDVLEESPSLRYVPPPPSVSGSGYGWSVCATAGGGAIKLVNIFPRCCCGGAGASECRLSHHAFAIHTWTLMETGWVMDGVVDATELWSLDAYRGLPRVPLVDAVVSLYEPHVIRFSLCETYYCEYGGSDNTLWLVMVDMRSKTIRSVSRQTDSSLGRVVTSNVSCYFNPDYPSCSSSGDCYSTSLMDQIISLTTTSSEMDNEKKKKRDDDDYDGTKLIVQSPAQAYDEILAAFREIPSYGWACDDMLKAYAILSSDDGCRVRSLLKLPTKLRKNWLLMEMKADDA